MAKTQYDDDNISLKELILATKAYLLEVLRNWWVVGLFVLPFLAFYVNKSLNSPVEYPARVRFLVEGSTKSGIGGLLGSLGIGAAGANKMNPHKIIEVAKSRRIMDQVLFDTSATNNQMIANNIIDKYKLFDAWAEEKIEYENFHFTSGNVANFNPTEMKAYVALMGFVITCKSPLLNINLNQDNGIFRVMCSAQDEDLTIDLTTKTFDRVKEFFEDKLNENDKKTREIFFNKRDSLKALIELKTTQMAYNQDRNLGSVTSIGIINRTKLSNEISALVAAYSEVAKTFEIADYNALNRKPMFLLIDRPYAPITPIAQSLVVNLFIAIFLGSFVGVGFVVLRKIYREAMAEE
ncbi:MAG: hypothetical protein V3V14_01275 [Saprospiraceae bacterium]